MHTMENGYIPVCHFMRSILCLLKSDGRACTIVFNKLIFLCISVKTFSQHPVATSGDNVDGIPGRFCMVNWQEGSKTQQIHLIG